jgi:MoxR-like ATPase
LPLLLTGDPGCGKSRLADAVADELGFGEALRYTVKSDAQGSDLFYRFDTLARFRNASDVREERREAREFVTYHGLGLALLRAKGKGEALKKLMREEQWNGLKIGGERSVVLIDEIDKAPREVPNDLLTEIEDLSFKVPELGWMNDIKLEKREQANRPIVIVTSNSERDLPPAFLRRCIYFHVELPPFRAELGDKKPIGPPPVTIEDIVDARLGKTFEAHDVYLRDALSLFRRLQNAPLAQKPSLAELLQWLLYLGRHLPERKTRLKDHAHFDAALGVLVKPHNRQERDRLAEELDAWKKSLG